MKRTTAWALALLGIGLGMTGCDQPPAVPRPASGEKIGSLDISHESEAAAAQQLIDAASLYDFHLSVLEAYYTRTGEYQKQQWARNEKKNLQQALTYRYKGVEPSPLPPSPNIETTGELDLVGTVVSARQTFLAAIDATSRFYQASGQDYKAKLTENVRVRFDPIRTYNYFLDAEVPPADLRPVEVIPQAEQLYWEAMQLYKAGKILPAVVDYQKERQALIKFLELVRKYPTSTKIAYSAYYIGEIYKEYFNEDYRSVLWYERAWQWDPNITEPARFQAAVVCDHRLHNRSRAVELYKEVLKYETFNGSNVWYSRERIEDLTGLPYQPQP